MVRKRSGFSKKALFRHYSSLGPEVRNPSGQPDRFLGVFFDAFPNKELVNKHFLIAVYMQNELTLFAWILNWGDTPNAENRDPKSQRSLEGLNQFASKALGPYFESQGPHFEFLRS